MKQKRLVRNVGLVALSAVLVGGTALAFTACKGNSDYTMSVNIFCSAADVVTNRAICEKWAQEWSKEHAEELEGNTIEIDFTSTTEQQAYFTELGNQISGGQYADVIYLSPSRAVSYAMNGHVLNMTDYIKADQTLMEQVSSIWPDSLAFYSTTGSGLGMTHASGVSYTGSTFVDPANNQEVSIYGLPKDYSNFGLGYNANFFTEQFKKAYTTLTPASGDRLVKTHLYKENTSVQGTFDHTGANAVGEFGTLSIEYAVSGTYTNPYTGATVEAVEGEQAPFISVGVPVRYRPFNYYKYANFDAAYAAGDPLALTLDYYTNGEGYIVTIPGFPGETFEITDSDTNAKPTTETTYDADTGYMTLTWTEFSALNWACAYMLNAFAWDSAEGVKTVANEGNQVSDYEAWFEGQGGAYTGAGGDTEDTNQPGDFSNFYGGEQYEQGTFGANGYVLPWLYSNDSSYIDSTYSRSLNTKNAAGETIAEGGNGSWSWTNDNGELASYIGYETETVAKSNLDGTKRNANVQFGVNSANFMETYAAFQDYCAIWNAHDGQAGDISSNDPATDKTFNGQNTFVGGYSFFYGVGTWDVSEYQEVDKDILTVGVMPTAVSNKFSLYSQTRDPYYGALNNGDAVVTYHNTATGKGTADGANNDSPYDDGSNGGLKIYSTEEIRQNQLLRQDKWGGRMDSVGYAVNGHLGDKGYPEWKASAAVSLVLALTVDPDSQRTLTYGGAQIPNVVSMCTDYLNETGSFSAMITPDDAEWDEYYALAKEMAEQSIDGNTATVAEYLNGKQINGADVAYDAQYASTRLCDFTKAGISNTRIAYAMRVLQMIGYTKADRDLVIRMQTGLNAARDQLLYTQGTGWITKIDATADSPAFFAYRNQSSLEVVQSGQTQTDANRLVNGTLVALKPSQYDATKNMIMTPAVYLIRQALTSQESLDVGD